MHTYLHTWFHLFPSFMELSTYCFKTQKSLTNTSVPFWISKSISSKVLLRRRWNKCQLILSSLNKSCLMWKWTVIQGAKWTSNISYKLLQSQKQQRNFPQNLYMSRTLYTSQFFSNPGPSPIERFDSNQLHHCPACLNCTFFKGQPVWQQALNQLTFATIFIFLSLCVCRCVCDHLNSSNLIVLKKKLYWLKIAISIYE